MTATAPSRLGLLSAGWASALLLHQLWWGGFEVRSPHFAVVVAALWVLLRPASVGRLALLLATETVVVAREMPAVHSHTLLVLVCGASVLAWLGAATLGGRALPAPETAFRRIAPFLGAAVVLLYAAAGLAKLNSSFLDPALSCAAGLSAQIAWFDPSLLAAADWRIRPAIYGTIATELALPVLLAVRRTRWAGLLLGVGFHAVLALAGNVPFSSLMLALYVAFLPAGALPRGLGAWRAPAVAIVPLVGAWLLGAVLAAREPELARTAIGWGTRIATVGLLLGAAVVLVRARRAFGAPASRRHIRPLLHPAFAVGLLLLVANAASPYVGFKTESAFAMFSNLRTEPGEWNHLLIGERARVLGYQDELVRVRATNDPALRRRAAGARLVRYELERYLRRRPASRADFAGAPARGSAATPVLDRVAKFRDVRGPGC